jgi:osmotically-inducible protein OsmY
MTVSLWGDAKLEDLVRGRLLHDVGPGLRDLDVFSMTGRVRICGEATSYADKKRAEQIAASLDGVRRVINQLRVTPVN